MISIYKVSSLLLTFGIDAVDYKNTLSGEYDSEAARIEALSKCHSRSAQRVFEALLANGGSFDQYIIVKAIHMVFFWQVFSLNWASICRLCKYIFAATSLSV